MAKIVKVSESDYRLKVQSSGTITLDTGSNVGTVYITGNLEVQGTTTTIDTANMTIEDNVILLNKGETGAGVSEGTSGLEIDRGSLDNAQLLWDESLEKFVFQTTDGLNDTIANIKVGSIATVPDSNLEFDMQSGGGMLRITNSTDYSSRVLDDDDIPNKKYVNDYVYASGGSAVVSRFKYPVGASYGSEDTLGEALISSIKFWVKSTGFLQQRAQITASGLDVDNINLFADTIRNSSVSNNLILTALNNNVEVNGVLNLDDQSVDPTATGGATRVYSKTLAGPGKSGLYFANNTTSDELVAKNRALLFSILF
jgi:hypothetical protein